MVMSLIVRWLVGSNGSHCFIVNSPERKKPKKKTNTARSPKKLVVKFTRFLVKYCIDSGVIGRRWSLNCHWFSPPYTLQQH